MLCFMTIRMFNYLLFPSYQGFFQFIVLSDMKLNFPTGKKKNRRAVRMKEYVELKNDFSQNATFKNKPTCIIMHQEDNMLIVK